MGFACLNLSVEVTSALEEIGFKEPTPIQSLVIPVFLSQGRDVVAQAQTGTGKTAAFAIPLIETLTPKTENDIYCDALILTPTRELAQQVCEEISNIGKHKNITALSIYGGTSVDNQAKAIRQKVNIIVATLGRALDHINRGNLKLNHVKYFVLDEADQMLDMGFIDDIEHVMTLLPKIRRILLFSATMPEPIKQIAKKHLTDPAFVSASPSKLMVPKIEQIFYRIQNWERFEGLCRVLESFDPEVAFVFCQTKKEIKELEYRLEGLKYKVESLHGDLSQFQRDRVMTKVRQRNIGVLITSDVAARGIDVSDIDLVINYTVPQNPENYIHRIGRTGRAGKNGVAITFTSFEEEKALKSIERTAKFRCQYHKLPDINQLRENRLLSLQAKIADNMEDENSLKYLKHAESLLENYSPVEALSSVLKLAFENSFRPLFTDDKNRLNSRNTGGESGMVRFFINAGHSKNLTPGDIVRMIVKHTSLNGSFVGKIRIDQDYSFVEVPQDGALDVLEKLSNVQFKNYTLDIKPATNKPRVRKYNKQN